MDKLIAMISLKMYIKKIHKFKYIYIYIAKERKFVSKNVINLSNRNLSQSEISLLSKGLKFVPSANEIDRAKLKRELEEYGRKLRLIWHFRNDEQTFSTDKFRPKSFFNPRIKRRLCTNLYRFPVRRMSL